MSELSAPGPLVAVVMGSDSDLPTMQPAVEMLQGFGVATEVRVLSAHRTPLEMVAFAQQAAGRGFMVIIAGAGGAAHLPGMVASLTPLPVIGVCANPRPLRRGFTALDRADARWHPRGHRGDRQRCQRWAAGCPDPRYGGFSAGRAR